MIFGIRARARFYPSPILRTHVAVVRLVAGNKAEHGVWFRRRYW